VTSYGKHRRRVRPQTRRSTARKTQQNTCSGLRVCIKPPRKLWRACAIGVRDERRKNGHVQYQPSICRNVPRKATRWIHVSCYSLPILSDYSDVVSLGRPNLLQLASHGIPSVSFFVNRVSSALMAERHNQSRLGGQLILSFVYDCPY